MNRALIALAIVGMSLAACKRSDDHPSNRNLQLEFADSVYQLTGVAISKEGRLFTNYPLWSDIYRYALVEVLPGNQVRPYPNAYMNSSLYHLQNAASLITGISGWKYTISNN